MKIALITGASSGMGREFVLQLDRAERFDSCGSSPGVRSGWKPCGAKYALPCGRCRRI